MKRRWELRPRDPDRAETLASALDLPPLVAAILAGRGFDEASARRFFDVDLRSLAPPDALPDIALAVDRIARALRLGERITLYGDYDVDGTTSTAILVELLREVGAEVDWHIPDRFRDGYGLSCEGMETIAARNTKLVITADCGTSSFEEIERARALGMDVIVLDHHQTPEARPAAIALLNPHRHDSTFPDRGLCSAGLAFYLAAAVRRRLREDGAFAGSGRGEPDLKALLDLVALGTVADVVPLVGQNRVLVHHGLRSLATTSRPGLASLKSIAGVGADVTSGQIAFRLAPRINAAGRLGDASRAVELMLCREPQRGRALAETLDAENARRQEIEKAVVEDAIAQALAEPDVSTSSAIVVAGDGWHPGVVGIVAARLVERFARPAIVLGVEGGVAKGSARTTGGVHLYRALGSCAELVTKFGGHAAAAGLTLPASRVGAFRQRFCEVVGKIEPETRLARRLIDCELAPGEVSMELLETLDRLRPFGEGNAEPTFLARDVLVRSARVVGGAHLRLDLEGGISAIGFRMANDAPRRESRVDLCYAVRMNEWQGARRAELQLVEPPRGAGEASR